MKVKSILKKLNKGVKKIINKVFKSNKSFNCKRLNTNNNITVKILDDKSNLYYSVRVSDDSYKLVPYNEYKLYMEKQVENGQNHIKTHNTQIEVYENKKYFIRNSIQSVYLKAKDFYVTINGDIFNTNKLYRDSIELYNKIRMYFKYNYHYEIMKNDILRDFVKDNNIDLENITNNFEILFNLFITDVYSELYDILINFNRNIRIKECI